MKHFVCNKDTAWNPSICACEFDRAYKIEKILKIANTEKLCC